LGKRNYTLQDLKGDESFKELFLNLYSPLCNYAFGYTGDSAVAEDIVQELFIRFWENDALLFADYPERYLLKSVKFKCIDFIRMKKNSKEVRLDTIPDDPTNTPTDLSDEDIEPLLYYFAVKLPPKTREVFLLSRQSGYTYKEIASSMKISVKTVENQMGRALKQMKTFLKEHNFLSLLPFL